MIVKLKPYTEIDGIPTMRDSEVISMLEKVENDGTWKDCFFGDSKATKESFLSRIKFEPRTMFFAVEVDQAPAGFCFLDNMSYRHAQGHFCVFKEFWGKESVEISKEVYGQLLERRFSVLIGIIPVELKHVLDFCEMIGMKKKCVIPDYFYIDDEDRYVDGVLFTIKEG
jgi:hypothetical protein